MQPSFSQMSFETNRTTHKVTNISADLTFNSVCNFDRDNNVFSNCTGGSYQLIIQTDNNGYGRLVFYITTKYVLEVRSCSIVKNSLNNDVMVFELLNPKGGIVPSQIYFDGDHVRFFDIINPQNNTSITFKR